jgi:hypothetical protein
MALRVSYLAQPQLDSDDLVYRILKLEAKGG